MPGRCRRAVHISWWNGGLTLVVVHPHGPEGGAVGVPFHGAGGTESTGDRAMTYDGAHAAGPAMMMTRRTVL